MAIDTRIFAAGLAAATARVDAAVLTAVDLYGEHVLGDAQELAPVATGALKASGTTTPAGRVGDGVEKAIGFGVDYAVFVHEDLDARHDQGRAKFLETALRENAPKFVPYVQKQLKAAGL